MNIYNVKGNDNFFDPNNFTEKNNPYLAFLYQTLQSATDWGKDSEAYRTMLHNTCSLMDELASTLNPEQNKALNKLYDHLSACSLVSDTENFIRGFVYATKLMYEGLKI